jgi:hypothetical protein
LRDGACINPGNGFRPGRILVDTIGCAGKIAEELVGAAAAARQKIAIMPPGPDHFARQRQHQCRVRVGADRPPFCADPVGQVVFQRRNQNDPNLALDQPA